MYRSPSEGTRLLHPVEVDYAPEAIEDISHRSAPGRLSSCAPYQGYSSMMDSQQTHSVSGCSSITSPTVSPTLSPVSKDVDEDSLIDFTELSPDAENFYKPSPSSKP